jgi:hypothetical protein
MIKNYLSYAVATALLVASGNLAFAAEVVEKEEANNAFEKPQLLMVDDNKTVSVRGTIGVLTGAAVPDIDYYSFYGRKGEKVDIDIDGAFKPSVRSLDSMIAIWGPGGLFEQIDDPRSTDEGSVRFPNRDARLDQILLKESGLHVVAVTSAGKVGSPARKFLDNGTVTSFVDGLTANGAYLLIISGVSPSAKQISIDIKPGADRYAPVNPKSRGNIPVALLSSDDFNALMVDRGSIRFGPTGQEATARCGKDGEYVDADQRLDLVCHFDNQAAGFDASDEVGIVTGKMIDGMPFEGRGGLKVIQVKRPD